MSAGFPSFGFFWFSFVILCFHLAVVLHFISFFPVKLLDYLMCVSAPLQAVNSVELGYCPKLGGALCSLFNDYMLSSSAQTDHSSAYAAIGMVSKLAVASNTLAVATSPKRVLYGAFLL